MSYTHVHKQGPIYPHRYVQFFELFGIGIKGHVAHKERPALSDITAARRCMNTHTREREGGPRA
jgi:hypothetical protein